MAGRINKRELLRRALSATGGMRLLESAPMWSGLLVLNYHRIGTPDNPLMDEALWSATQDDFDQQVRLLKNGFDVIGLEDLTDAVRDLQNGQRRPWQTSRFAMITFDDGYRDNFELAFPVLKSHGVPGAFFLATGFLDQPKLAWWDEINWMLRSSDCRQLDLPANWFVEPLSLAGPGKQSAIRDLLQLYYRLDGSRTTQFLDAIGNAAGTGRVSNRAPGDLWMTWDMVREMRHAGMSFGAHTVSHPILANLSNEEQSDEILESRLRIESELGQPVTALSYPVGKRESFNDGTRDALSGHGFDWAFSYYGGHFSGAEFDRFDIPRVAVESDVTLDEFRSCCALPHVFARH